MKPARPAAGWTDAALTTEIARIETGVRKWLETNDLWYDCGFNAYLSHVKGEPSSPPIVTMIWCEGPLYGVLSGEDPEGYEPRFRNLLEGLGYYYENVDGVTMALYPEDPDLEAAFADYFHWQWVCGLIEEDTADVYEELYAQFVKRPEQLERLDWRAFEILLFRIFQNQGFEAILGPGRGDQGIDLTLVQRAPLGDILTLVQAKRYAPRNKIDQTQVAALYGVGHLEGAQRTLFVTTSSYAPVARNWAARTGGYLELAEAADVVRWCANAEQGIIRDKSSLVSSDHLRRLLGDINQRRDPRVVQASGGWNITANWFAVVLKESRCAALLMALPRTILPGSEANFVGWEIPRIDETAFAMLSRNTVWRARRSVDENGRVSYWDGNQLYHPWDGEACHFNHMD